MRSVATWGQRVLRQMLEAGGQRATVARVSWDEPPAGATEEVSSLAGVTREALAHVEMGRPRREQDEAGQRTHGSYQGVLLRDVPDEAMGRGTYLKMTAGQYEGEYFRVVGVPDKPMGHHWELELELAAEDDPVRDGDLLA